MKVWLNENALAILNEYIEECKMSPHYPSMAMNTIIEEWNVLRKYER